MEDLTDTVNLVPITNVKLFAAGLQVFASIRNANRILDPAVL